MTSSESVWAIWYPTSFPFVSLLRPSLIYITIVIDHCWISVPSLPVILESPRRLESGRVLVQLEWRNLPQRLTNGQISCGQTHIYGSARPRSLLLSAICRSSACLIFPGIKQVLTYFVVAIHRNQQVLTCFVVAIQQVLTCCVLASRGSGPRVLGFRICCHLLVWM